MHSGTWKGGGGWIFNVEVLYRAQAELGACSRALVNYSVQDSARSWTGVRLWISSWLVAKLEASGTPSKAQIVTCRSRQNQTTMTKGGSDIILYGLAGRDDGIIIAMASHQMNEPRIG